VTDRAPYVAGMVHRATDGGCRAAVITAVHQGADGVVVDLTEFTVAGGAVPFAGLPHGTQPGSWHWPDEG
jgi:hypothetical protein